MKRTLLKEKADFTLNASNFLTPDRECHLATETAQFRSNQRFYSYPRAVRPSFNYPFGKLENNAQRQRRSIQNDDGTQGSSKSG